MVALSELSTKVTPLGKPSVTALLVDLIVQVIDLKSDMLYLRSG